MDIASENGFWNIRFGFPDYVRDLQMFQLRLMVPDKPIRLFRGRWLGYSTDTYPNCFVFYPMIGTVETLVARKWRKTIELDRGISLYVGVFDPCTKGVYLKISIATIFFHSGIIDFGDAILV